MSAGDCKAIRGSFLMLEENLLGPGEAEGVRAHLADCPGCRAAWEAWDAESRRLRAALRPVRPPRDVVGAALAGICRGIVERRVAPPRTGLGWKVAMAAAAAALIAGAVWALAPGRRQRLGEVAGVVGSPTEETGGFRAARALGLGAPVYEGSRVVTGAQDEAELCFDDGSRLVIKKGADVKLSLVGEAFGLPEHKLPHVCLRQGEVECELRSPQYFRAVATPLGAVVTFGAWFRMKQVPGVRTCLEVLAGEVTFCCPTRTAVAKAGEVWVVEASTGSPRRASREIWEK